MKRYNLINNSLGWLCFAIAAVSYLLTIEPTASFWDCPEFISQGALLEVGHPPGNPIFMLTARFCVTLFGGGMDVAAVAVNSMSAILSALTILLLFWTVTALVRRLAVPDGTQELSLTQMLVVMGSGLCGALAYAWSDTFWFSAVEGEVYAFSSFCTALVFWLILKWEVRADDPGSDRYLILIAYVIGVSIAVHLLNLLCIPAIMLVVYYRKRPEAGAKGSLIALGVSFVIVAAILYGLVPGFIKVAQWFELATVNGMDLPYNSGALLYAVALLTALIATVAVLYRRRNALLAKLLILACLALSGLLFITGSQAVWAILIIAAAVWLFFFCKHMPYRAMTIGTLSVLVIFIGYSSYALLLIRASANTPMNQNAPDNVFSLASYLNREQYGQRPLFYGPAFAEELEMVDYKGQRLVMFDETGRPKTKAVDPMARTADGLPIDNGKSSFTKAVKASPDEPDRYVDTIWTPDYAYAPDLCMPFTRIYSTDPEHVKAYKSWCLYYNSDLEDLPTRAGAENAQRWSTDMMASDTELLPYFQDLQRVSVYKDHPEYAQYVWKASMADNLRFFLNYQLNHMYWRYFMWNFAGRQNDIQGNGEPHLGNWISGIPVIDNARLGDQSLLPDEFGKGNKGHNVFFMLPLILGILGIIWQALMKHPVAPQRGIQQFWVVFFLFFMTGIAIVLYLNQTPGQPRERDYAFAGSFYAFAIWIGMGVAAIARMLTLALARKGETNGNGGNAAPRPAYTLTAAIVAAAIGIIVPLQMVSQTWDDHDRSHRYTARDFGMNYLNSLDDNAIIFTNGDNDTFPLWYAQEVEGERTDVRVVNLSYLSTDWYANQLLHPSHNAAPVPMLAKPTDWAYESLAYSYTDPRVKPDSTVDALTALKEFYASAPSTAFTTKPIKLLRNPNMTIPADSAVLARFNIAGDTALQAAYGPIATSALQGGFSLSKLLSLDIIASSMADGMKRPVYFATTVPSRYYLGLEPYMYPTGLAMQVTPFAGSAVSPVADKAYENIVDRFRWGGLDDPVHGPELYLDETVRRMVATVRNSILEAATRLMDDGDAPASEFARARAREEGRPEPLTRRDMARHLLHLSQEKLPEAAARYESYTDIPMIEMYLRLYNDTGNADDLARASALIDSCLARYAQLSRYAASLNASRLHALGNSETFALSYVPVLIGFKNYINLLERLNANPEANAEQIAKLKATLSADNGRYVYHWLYLEDYKADELREALTFASEEAGDYSELVRQAIDLSEAHAAAGVAPMAITEQVCSDYGLTVQDLKRLNP